MITSLQHHDQQALLLDNYARRNPKAYRIQVAALAILGYGYLLLVFLVLGLALPALVWLALKNFSFLVATIFASFLAGTTIAPLLLCLRLKFTVGDGIPVSRNDCPALFEMIDRVARCLGVSTPQHVLISEDLNASFTPQKLRFGLLHRNVNYLVIGMPLLQCMSLEEVEQTIAHELGHHFNDHDTWEWLIRAGEAWKSLPPLFENTTSPYAAAVRWFAKWYVPRYQAHSMALRRSNEYVADHCAARATSVETVAQTLIDLEIRGKLFQEITHAKLREAASTSVEPPSGITSVMYTLLREAPSADLLARWKREAGNSQNNGSDTHPVLRARLSALGYSLDADIIAEVGTVSRPAAETLLHPNLPRLIDKVDTLWRKNNAPRWESFHKRGHELRKQLDQANLSEANGTLTPLQMKQRIDAVAFFESRPASIPYIRQAIALLPEDAALRYVLGLALLEQGDISGEEELLRAVALNPRDEYRVTERLHLFWTLQAEHDRAAEYKQRWYAAQVIEEAFEKERASYSLSDAAEPHRLDAERVDNVVALLRHEPEILNAYLVRKMLRVFADSVPVYGLVIECRSGEFAPGGRVKRIKLLNKLKPLKIYPKKTFLIVAQRGQARVSRIAREIPDSLIYTAANR